MYSSSDELVMAHIIWHAIIIVVFPKNDTAISWVLSSHLWILYHHVSPLQRNFQKFAGVVMQCTLHCHSILTTPLPLRSGNAVLICIFATHLMPLRHHTPTPLQSHSLSTLQCHSGVHTPLPLHYYHSNATLTEHSNATPECLWSVNLHICDALLCHSDATPIPLHKVGVAS